MKSVNSTNDTAIKLIRKNQLRPTLISSIIQKKGRGTMGKKWISLRGNLFISIFFQVYNKGVNFKQFAILNAYLIKKIIAKYSKKKIDIKWHNDLLINNKKVCGILQEVIFYKKKQFLIIGIGINTNVSPLSNKLRSTSLKEMTKKKINNNIIINEIKKKYQRLLQDIKRYSFFDLKRKITGNKWIIL